MLLCSIVLPCTEELGHQQMQKENVRRFRKGELEGIEKVKAAETTTSEELFKETMKEDLLMATGER